jgi:glucosamine 6-phosphate synthetase-like amidotransferase/phosphosugar isomerase protein
MCGLFGFAKKQNSQNDEQLAIARAVLEHLAIESQTRGKDSTGLSLITPDARKTYKGAIAATEFVKNKKWKEISATITSDTTIAIGHTRFATHGTVSIRNAHPFNVGQVTGAHNGIIFNYNKLAKEMGKSVEVDSEVIFGKLNTTEKTKAFEDIYGDFAVSWVKDDNRILHLAREDGRPLSIAYWKRARIMFYASTDTILRSALNKAGMTLNISDFPKDMIYTYNTEKFNKTTNPEKAKFHTVSQDYTQPIALYKTYEDASYQDYCEVCGDHAHDYTGRCKIHYESLYGNHTVICSQCNQEYPEKNTYFDEAFCVDICENCIEIENECAYCGDLILDLSPATRGVYTMCVHCADIFDNEFTTEKE